MTVAASLVPMMIAAQMAAAEKAVLERLRAAGALSPGRAADPAPENDAETSALERLRERRVVRDGDAPGLVWLDEPALAAEAAARSRTNRRAGIILAVVAAIALAATLLVLLSRS